MSLLTVANLSLSFGTRKVLDGINLTLAPGEHVGLVGRNGCGKSTLMKLIAGVETHKPDQGQLQLSRGAKAGYLTQDPNLDLTLTLREEAGRSFAHLQALHDELARVSHDMAEARGDELERLLKRYEKLESEMHAAGGYAVDHQVDATLHGVGLTDNLFDVRVADLSGGQKGRLALAKLLLSRPDVLLLDEPTNHLDIAGREWLEAYLRDYPGAVLVVSHDRWLLDRVVTKIYEIEDGRLVEYPGNYHKYRELRAERRLAQLRMYEKQQDRIRHEQAFIDRYRAGQRAKQAKGREKRLERFVDQDLIERPIESDAMSVRFRAVQRCSDNVIVAEGLAKGYEGKPLFGDFTLTIKRGDRVGVIGPNGAGKSTLIACLLGLTQADRGRAQVGASVSAGHYRQTHEHLPLQLTVVDYLRKFVPDELEQSARDLAGAFLFSGLDQDKQLAVMSGGERARAILAGLVAGAHNLLVLDEPTNHLDIPSAERLEEALRSYTEQPKGWGAQTTGGGTLILITHDRMLLDDLVNQLIVLDGQGGIRHFLGNYSEYLAWQARQSQAAAEAPKPRAAPAPKRPPEPTRNTAPKAPRGPHASLKQDQLEQRIEKTETALREIDEQLANPDIYKDRDKFRALEKKREQLASELAPLEAEWLRRAEA
jgi:ATP-binding cassette subfamily F protein 3